MPTQTPGHGLMARAVDWLPRAAPAATQSSGHAPTQPPARQSAPRSAVGFAVLALVLWALTIYGRSLTTPLVGGDWALIERSAGGLGASLCWIGSYHYTSVTYVVLFVLHVVLSPLAHEPEVALLPVCMLCRLLVVEHGASFTLASLRERAGIWARDFTLPVVFLVLYLVFNVWLGRSVPHAPGLQASLNSHLLDIGRAFQLALLPGFGFEGSLAPLPLGFLDNYRVGLVIGGMAVIAGALLLLRGTPVQRFLLVTLALVGAEMTLGMGGISSRHILLHSVLAVILWTRLLADLTRWASRVAERSIRDPQQVQVASYIPAALVMGIWVLCGTQFAFVQEDAWHSTGLQVDRLEGQIEAPSQALPYAKELYLINMPDSAPSPTGDVADVMHMFRNSFPSLIHLTLPGRFTGVVAVHIMNTPPVPVGVPITASQLDTLSRQPGTLLKEYNWTTRSLKEWQGARK